MQSLRQQYENKCKNDDALTPSEQVQKYFPYRSYFDPDPSYYHDEGKKISP